MKKCVYCKQIYGLDKLGHCNNTENLSVLCSLKDIEICKFRKPTIIEQLNQSNKEIEKQNRIIKILKNCLVTNFKKDEQAKIEMAKNINAKAKYIIKLQEEIRNLKREKDND